MKIPFLPLGTEISWSCCLPSIGNTYSRYSTLSSDLVAHPSVPAGGSSPTGHTTPIAHLPVPAVPPSPYTLAKGSIFSIGYSRLPREIVGKQPDKKPVLQQVRNAVMQLQRIRRRSEAKCSYQSQAFKSLPFSQEQRKQQHLSWGPYDDCDSEIAMD